jgi:hypothetical protein
MLNVVMLNVIMECHHAECNYGVMLDVMLSVVGPNKNALHCAECRNETHNAECFEGRGTCIIELRLCSRILNVPNEKNRCVINSQQKRSSY